MIHKTSIAILFVITLCLRLILPSSALDFSIVISRDGHRRPKSARSLARKFLDAHNKARREVGLDQVVWDADLAAYAASYASRRAEDCALIHSHGPFGENIACGSGELLVRDAVKMWVDEKRYYEDDNATCHAPYGGTCLHYTQVAWRDTVRIGCAKVRCKNGGTFITCNYYPPGNHVGQKPY
ncbi:PREDICTED: pathogenesis-related protein 1B-like [Tarenaya hassleriana]|uniref:pathogenesis-related protein 1B-like n=1 Tax=Tarenaya hassleriana TaxID=28532 RepID=UPI00053C4047|nr:PREDICTED: pathogenesis-related protein 1B-like [Tarenaya hassleriana]